MEGGHGFRWVGIRKECTQEGKTVGSPSTTGARTVGIRPSRQECENDSQKLEEAPGLQHWPFPEQRIFLQREGAVKSPEVRRKSAEQTHHQAGALVPHNSELTMCPHLGWLLGANPLPP